MTQKVLYVNSDPAFRDALGTDEDFTITTTNIFNTTPLKAKLVSASIPYTWNNIDNTNNSLDLLEFPGPNVFPVTVSTGNYTGTTLATALQTALNASGGAFVYTVTFDTTSQKFTIAGTGNFALDFTVANSLGDKLGFGNVVTPTGVTITSTNVANILVDYEIFICSDLVGGVDNGVIFWIPGTPTNNQIIARVPITTTYGEIINYTSNSTSPFYSVTQSNFGKVKSSRDTSDLVVRFFLQFPSGYTVDLNGAHWTAEVILEFP